MNEWMNEQTKYKKKWEEKLKKKHEHNLISICSCYLFNRQFHSFFCIVLLLIINDTVIRQKKNSSSFLFLPFECSRGC